LEAEGVDASSTVDPIVTARALEDVPTRVAEEDVVDKAPIRVLDACEAVDPEIARRAMGGKIDANRAEV
jgi:hypothetical protein